MALIPYNVAPGAGLLTAVGLNPMWEAFGMQVSALLTALGGIALADAQKLRGARRRNNGLVLQLYIGCHIVF